MARIPPAGTARRTPALVGLVLVVGLAAAFGAFVPIANCPACGGPVPVAGVEKVRVNPNAWCERCRRSGRVTLFKRWFSRPGREP